MDNPQAFREVTLFDYLGVLLRRRWLVLASIVICGSASAIYAFTAAKLYRVEVILASTAETNSGLLSGLSSQLGPLAGAMGLGQLQGPDRGAEAIATLMSQAFLQDFTRENGLLPLLFDDTTDGDAATTADAAELWLDSILNMRQDTATGFWTLSVIWHDREQAADWAMRLVRAVNDHKRRQDQEEARKAIAFLQDRLDTISNIEIRESLYSLLESQMKVEMLADVRDEYVLRVIGAAVVPDEDQFAYPRRGMLIFFGVVGGLGFGICLAFLFEYGATARRQ